MMRITPFSNNESSYISTENDYRQFIILKDPKFSDVTLSLNEYTGNFITGENVLQVNYKTLAGTAQANAACTTVVGTLTDFENSLAANEKIIIFDVSTGFQCIRTVTGVTNSTAISLNTPPDFNSPFATIAAAQVLATGVKSGETLPFLKLSNAEPKFITGKKVIGENSGAIGTIDGISVQEKNYNNWNTFDNRTRLQYTSNTAAFSNDAVVFQNDVSVANAYFHSANDTFVFLTSEKGPLNADSTTTLDQAGGGASYVVGSTKYIPDLENRSGEVLYIENKDPISRSNTQSETFKLVLEF
jgi:hypothetical protein